MEALKSATWYPYRWRDCPWCLSASAHTPEDHKQALAEAKAKPRKES